MPTIRTPRWSLPPDSEAGIPQPGVESEEAAELLDDRDAQGPLPLRRSLRLPAALALPLLALVALAGLLQLLYKPTKPAEGPPLGGTPTWEQLQQTSTYFEAVDGATDRVCRGSTTDDNSESYYDTVTEPTLESCQQRCRESATCQGVEFRASDSRCEVWTRPEGIGTSRPAAGYQCFRHVPFEPADGGEDRACRGDGPADSHDSYYILHREVGMNDCRALCISTSGCKGIEYAESHRRCEVWTRPGGILATWGVSGYNCQRLVAPATTTAVTTAAAVTTQAATTRTTQTTQTTQTTTTTETSQTTTTTQTTSTGTTTSTETTTTGPPILGFMPMEGGVDRACRGANTTDNSPDHYIAVGQSSLEDCKAHCASNPACQGIEHQASQDRCEVWTRPEGIESTVTVSGFECLRYGVLPNTITTTTGTTTTVTVDPLSFEPVDGGKDRACRGLGDALPSDYVVFSEPTLLACMSRCTVTLGCVGVEYNAGAARCEVWVRPGDLTSAAVSGFECFRYLNGPTEFSLPANPQGYTQYVVHFMPWFRGASSTPPHAHWCASYGNSYYDSALGTYDLTDPAVVNAQLDTMQDAGINGLWIDYQTKKWDTAIDVVVAALKPRGMGFAIVIDSAINSNIFAERAYKMAEWMSEPHYYRHYGTPIVPVFNDPDTAFVALPVPAIYVTRYEVTKPWWAHDTYPWINRNAVSNGQRYYREWHPYMITAAAYRGYRDCYPTKSLSEPLYDQLKSTLATASKYSPAFVQLLTWNDITEGTMLEPTWLRPAGQCRDICSPKCDTVDDCLRGNAFPDCSKPVGQYYGPGDPACGSTGNLSARGDLDIVKDHIQAERIALGLAARRHHAVRHQSPATLVVLK